MISPRAPKHIVYTSTGAFLLLLAFGSFTVYVLFYCFGTYIFVFDVVKIVSFQNFCIFVVFHIPQPTYPNSALPYAG